MMAFPKSTRVFRRTANSKNIELVTEPVPQTLKPTEILIRIHAVSLNFRDVAMLHDLYPAPSSSQGIPCSDAAASVVAIGSSVTEFKEGDAVSPTFRILRSGEILALGGDAEGVLREYAVYDTEDLTKVPAYLTPEEVSTIVCAGVTAWMSLDFDKKRQGKSALMQGTGGVSIFATLLCVAAGIKAIVTSSSDKKLEQVKKLGRDVQGINYKTHPDYAEEAKKLTGGKGVDVLVNNVGITSMEQSFSALADFGTISLVGFLGGMEVAKMPDCFTPVLMKGARVQGIQVGSREDQLDLCKFLEEKKISLKPLIDRVFDFEESAEAFEYLYSAAHTGKVVIKI